MCMCVRTYVDSVCLYTTKKDHYIVKRLPVHSSNCGATLMMCNTSSVPAICPQDVSIKKHSFNQHRKSGLQWSEEGAL